MHPCTVRPACARITKWILPAPTAIPMICARLGLSDAHIEVQLGLIGFDVGVNGEEVG